MVSLRALPDPRISCPYCWGEGAFTPPYMRRVTCGWCEGSGACVPPAPTPGIKACCDEARVIRGRCVCRYETWCPTHGTHCHGSHD